jgi:hypothetical protein
MRSRLVRFVAGTEQVTPGFRVIHWSIVWTAHRHRRRGAQNARYALDVPSHPARYMQAAGWMVITISTTLTAELKKPQVRQLVLVDCV